MSGRHLIVSFFAMAVITLPRVAFCVAVPALPSFEFADTEVTTNVPFAVCLDTMSRVEFTISLDASPTNCVEVSIGADADGDGCLSLDEADQTFGFRCGDWFARDAAADAETVMAEPRTGRLTKTFLLRRGRLNSAWNLVKVTRRGAGTIGELVVIEGRKPGFVLEVQ